jgi:Asp-tRNA(Asn)/Glu-tRNA(Gln) amidotransferase A subunit family amidase
VNCLTDWFFEDGLRQAREIDEALAKGGKLKGPLHGVPVALKIQKQNIHLRVRFGRKGTDIMTK